MYIILSDRNDRLGANITNYIAHFLFAYNNKYRIQYNKPIDQYRYYHSIFVQILFKYFDSYNISLQNDDDDEILISFQKEDYIYLIGFVLQTIKQDYVSFFQEHIFPNIFRDLQNISYHSIPLPFDRNNTILVHLRLDDTSNCPDYDGSSCSAYYRNRIENDEPLHYISNGNNGQHPLSKDKIVNVIKQAQTKFPTYKVILLTSPESDTSFLEWDVIKNKDESYDLFLLTQCSVVLLSRSTFSLSSLFLSNLQEKKAIYIPLWGHFVCFGMDTKYDKKYIKNVCYFY